MLCDDTPTGLNFGEDLCLGCMRKVMHKRCPAHGTRFYMSGIPYTEEIDATRKNYGVATVDAMFELFRYNKEKESNVSNFFDIQPLSSGASIEYMLDLDSCQSEIYDNYEGEWYIDYLEC